MERLLFESKGAPTMAVIMLSVGGGILSFFGLVLIVLSQMRRSSHFSYRVDYMVSEEARILLIVIGIISVVVGIVSLCCLPGLSKTVLRVYDYHIEGCYHIPILGFMLRKDYYIKYSHIDCIMRNQNVLTVHVSGIQKRIAVKNNQNAEIACRIIKQCIEYMKSQNETTMN